MSRLKDNINTRSFTTEVADNLEKVKKEHIKLAEKQYKDLISAIDLNGEWADIEAKFKEIQKIIDKQLPNKKGTSKNFVPVTTNPEKGLLLDRWHEFKQSAFSINAFNVGETGIGSKPSKLRITTRLCPDIRVFLIYSYCSSGVASTGKPLPCAAL
jgi:hypothetical protein